MADSEKSRGGADVVFDTVNEQVVIGAAIADARVRRTLVHQLSADEFLVPVHAPIWRTLKAITDRGLEYERETARAILAREGGDAEAATYLERLEDESAVPNNLDWHVSTVT